MAWEVLTDIWVSWGKGWVVGGVQVGDHLGLTVLWAAGWLSEGLFVGASLLFLLVNVLCAVSRHAGHSPGPSCWCVSW